jgi:hypothetical protein
MVTLAEYPNLHEARLVKKRLDNAGIPAHVRGEALALIGTRREFAPITVEIAEEDLEHAHRVLDEKTPGADEKAPAEHFPIDPDGLTTIAVFYDPLEAEHAVKLLRDQEIDCELRGFSTGFIAALAPGLVNLRLVVHEDDIDRACGILRFAEKPTEGDVPIPSGDCDERIRAAERQKWLTNASSQESPSLPRQRPEAIQPAAPNSSNGFVEETAPPAEIDGMNRWPQVEAGPEGGWIRWVLAILLLFGVFLWLILQ